MGTKEGSPGEREKSGREGVRREEKVGCFDRRKRKEKRGLACFPTPLQYTSRDVNRRA